MKIGDIVVCTAGFKWIIFDFSPDRSHVYLIDFNTQRDGGYCSINDIIHHEPKPENVEWLFLKRRSNNLKGLEKYL